MDQVPDALNLPRDGFWQAPVRAYLNYLPLPNERVSITEMIIHGAQLLESELDRALAEREITPASANFAGKITAAEDAVDDPERQSLWIALHLFRLLRNAYAHDIQNEELKSQRAGDFIKFTEDFMEINGEQIYPATQRQAFGLHIGITLVWESLCRFRGAPAGFSMVRPIMNNYAAELKRILIDPQSGHLGGRESGGV